MEDQTENGSRFRILTLIDEYTRQSLAVHAAWSIRALDVIAVLEVAIVRYGAPDTCAATMAQSLSPTRSRTGWRKRKSKPYTSALVVRGKTDISKAITTSCEMSASIENSSAHWPKPASSWKHGVWNTTSEGRTAPLATKPQASSLAATTLCSRCPPGSFRRELLLTQKPTITKSQSFSFESSRFRGQATAKKHQRDRASVEGTSSQVLFRSIRMCASSSGSVICGTAVI